MDNNENQELNLETVENLDDVTTVDLALQLSDYDDESLQKLCRKLGDEELARILEESELKTQLRSLTQLWLRVTVKQQRAPIKWLSRQLTTQLLRVLFTRIMQPIKRAALQRSLMPSADHFLSI